MKCSKAHSSVTADESNTRLTVENVRRTLHGVLNRSTGQKEPVATMEPKECLPTCTGRVLDVLSLIENHVLPLHTLEVLLILSDLWTESQNLDQQTLNAVGTYELITGDEDMERGILIVADLFLRPELTKRSAVLDVTPVR